MMNHQKRAPPSPHCQVPRLCQGSSGQRPGRTPVPSVSFHSKESHSAGEQIRIARTYVRAGGGPTWTRKSRATKYIRTWWCCYSADEGALRARRVGQSAGLQSPAALTPASSQGGTARGGGRRCGPTGCHPRRAPSSAPTFHAQVAWTGPLLLCQCCPLLSRSRLYMPAPPTGRTVRNGRRIKVLTLLLVGLLTYYLAYLSASHPRHPRWSPYFTARLTSPRLMPRAAWLAHMPFLRGPLRWRALPGAEARSLAWLSAGKWKPTRPDGAAPLTDPTMHAIPGVPPTHRANFKPTGPPSFPCTSPIQRTCIGGRAESTVQTLEVNRRKIQGSTPAHLHLCLLVFCNELARSLLATRMARNPVCAMPHP